jgi:hypothetical protein
MSTTSPDAHEQLLASIKAQLGSLTKLLDHVTDTWCEEDLVYRFWHQSFKVYMIQAVTQRIVDALEQLAPGSGDLDDWFRKIIDDGTGKTFEYEHNQRWPDETRPMLEAFWHAVYMLRMAVRYGTELEQVPEVFPSGWAALLHLYGIR